MADLGPTDLPLRPAPQTAVPLVQTNVDSALHGLSGGPSTSCGSNDAMSAAGSEDGSTLRQPAAKERISRLMNGKDEEWRAVTEKAGPLRLLDLPVDVLKDIVKEVTHTNDLTSLALCHSALHRLCIPQIYSRFDIVWPESSQHVDSRSGVDALTYGLATLVMAEDVFGETAPPSSPTKQLLGPHTCHHCGQQNTPALQPLSHPSQLFPRAKRRRRGNYYAQFTRKFSLGNGPSDWVQEYTISKEGGKMLGTLVALAIARMRNLETFIWDMPTGVLRDVWVALASLGERDDGQDCRLEKVWIRWHANWVLDGNRHPPTLPPMSPDAIPHALTNHDQVDTSSSNARNAATAYSNHVERPTFSILPPLKSLTVLEIDELAYLDEMSVLIARSKPCLRELRVGIARHARGFVWTAPWEGSSVQQNYSPNDERENGVGVRRLGGVLGVLVGGVYDVRKQRQSTNSDTATEDTTKKLTETQGQDTVTQDGATEQNIDCSIGPTTDGNQITAANESSTTSKSPNAASKSTSPRFVEELPPPDQSTEQLSNVPMSCSDQQNNSSAISRSHTTGNANQRRLTQGNCQQASKDNRLLLDTLELERVQLSITVMSGAFDWTKITSLTILDCAYHEQLWKMLRRKFSPRTATPSSPEARGSTSKRSSITAGNPTDYSLKLRKLHVNAVSPALITFLKETLAPNSLEVMFLQKSPAYVSNVTVEAIYKGPIRRHRGSMKKMSIDSSDRNPEDNLMENTGGWRQWMLNRDVLTFITSGKMPKLRELGFAIDHRDWHYFLQRLPLIPHIRSLAIPFIATSTLPPSNTAYKIDARELALQIVDIVTLRPEIELCYLGISTKCFEILEAKPGEQFPGYGDGDMAPGPGVEPTSGDEEGDEEDSGEEDADDEEGDDDDGGGGADGEDDEDGDEMDDGEDGESDDGGADQDAGGARLRLREILFYDDKVAIFRARLGRIC